LYPNIAINHPVFFGEGAQLENCVIGPFTTIGDGVIIKNSILWNSIIRTNAEVTKALLNNSKISPL